MHMYDAQLGETGVPSNEVAATPYKVQIIPEVAEEATARLATWYSDG
jgi:hypothetical protein